MGTAGIPKVTMAAMVPLEKIVCVTSLGGFLGHGCHGFQSGQVLQLVLVLLLLGQAGSFVGENIMKTNPGLTKKQKKDPTRNIWV